MSLDPKFDEAKDLIEILQFGFDLVDAVKKSIEDKKFGIGDIPNFIDPIWEAGAAFTGLENVPVQLKSKTCRALALEYFTLRLKDTPEKVTKKIVSSLNLVGEIYDVVLLWEE